MRIQRQEEQPKRAHVASAGSTSRSDTWSFLSLPVQTPPRSTATSHQCIAKHAWPQLGHRSGFVKDSTHDCAHHVVAKRCIERGVATVLRLTHERAAPLVDARVYVDWSILDEVLALATQHHRECIVRSYGFPDREIAHMLLLPEIRDGPVRTSS